MIIYLFFGMEKITIALILMTLYEAYFGYWIYKYFNLVGPIIGIFVLIFWIIILILLIWLWVPHRYIVDEYFPKKNRKFQKVLS
jgi:uncharacterized membrane protein